MVTFYLETTSTIFWGKGIAAGKVLQRNEHYRYCSGYYGSFGD